MHFISILALVALVAPFHGCLASDPGGSTPPGVNIRGALVPVPDATTGVSGTAALRLIDEDPDGIHSITFDFTIVKKMDIIAVSFTSSDLTADGKRMLLLRLGPEKGLLTSSSCVLLRIRSPGSPNVTFTSNDIHATNPLGASAYDTYNIFRDNHLYLNKVNVTVHTAKYPDGELTANFPCLIFGGFINQCVPLSAHRRMLRGK